MRYGVEDMGFECGLLIIIFGLDMWMKGMSSECGFLVMRGGFEMYDLILRFG